MNMYSLFTIWISTFLQKFVLFGFGVMGLGEEDKDKQNSLSQPPTSLMLGKYYAHPYDYTKYYYT